MLTRQILLVFIALISLPSCSYEKIETGNTLDKKTVSLLESLGLLETNEKIVKYYSNFSKEKAGNFFTNKRVAHYWLESRDAKKSDTTFAFYKDIVSIDTIYEVPDTYSPYMKVKLNDSTAFKVYVGGTRNEVKSFFEDAITTWKQNKLK